MLQSSGEQWRRPGGERRGGELVKRRRGSWGLYRAKDGRGHGIYWPESRREIAGDPPVRDLRRGRRRSSSRLRHVALTGETHLSVAEKEKKRSAAGSALSGGCWATLMGWPSWAGLSRPFLIFF